MVLRNDVYEIVPPDCLALRTGTFLGGSLGSTLQRSFNLGLVLVKAEKKIESDKMSDVFKA